MQVAKGLGRGINVFFPDLDVKEEETIQEITITELRPNPYQPRKHFNKEAIQELSASIKEHGILQPLIARKSIKGYEIVRKIELCGDEFGRPTKKVIISGCGIHKKLYM